MPAKDVNLDFNLTFDEVVVLDLEETDEVRRAETLLDVGRVVLFRDERVLTSVTLELDEDCGRDVSEDVLCTDEWCNRELVLDSTLR